VNRFTGSFPARRFALARLFEFQKSRRNTPFIPLNDAPPETFAEPGAAQFVS